MDGLMSGEHWLPVVGWEGRYEVSDREQVRSLDRVIHDKNGLRTRRFKGRVLTPWVNHGGYLVVGLPSDGRSSRHTINRLVHRLVAEAFLGPCPEGMEVLHGPRGTSDNTPANLRYGTPSENRFDTVRDGTNWHRNLTVCPRGHLLELPNLVPSKARQGRRQCLACSRANAKVHTQRKRYGIELDFKVEADLYYGEIMASVTDLPDAS